MRNDQQWGVVGYMKHLHLVSLGCAKNLVDSEVMLALLERAGYEVVEDPAEADLLLINTCGFIRPAVEEAVDEILRIADYKNSDPTKLLVVTGCMVQRYGADLQAEIPEIDLLVGLDDFPRIDRLIADKLAGEEVTVDTSPSTYVMDADVPRRISTPFFRSYLKITEGCDNRCSYCMIPSIRGQLRSRPIEDLVVEAQRLASSGVRELSLIAQDLTAFGDDFGKESNLVWLLEALLADTDIPWIRLLYLYPTGINDRLLRLMAREPRILPYLDIPFQHVSDSVLQRMNRRYGMKDLDALIGRIRRHIPDCAIRTTLLVGFPGETPEDAEQLVDSLERWQLDHVGVFQYQDEEGSAASLLKDKVIDSEKKHRFEQLMEVQAAISTRKLQGYVSRTEQVLVEGLSHETDLLLEGRTWFQAPDIDGCIYINSGVATPGDIVSVHITESHVYDLVGEVVSTRDIQ